MPDSDFFFDFVRQLSDWVKQSRPNTNRAFVTFAYQVFFMKKLWINTVPGDDRIADLMFHFPQVYLY